MYLYAVKARHGAVAVIEEQREFSASQYDRFDAGFILHLLNDALELGQCGLFYNTEFKFFKDPFCNQLAVFFTGDNDVDSAVKSFFI